MVSDVSSPQTASMNRKKRDAKGKQKQPYAIATADDAPMVMAGL
jgi:putative SOS response-associated peptidase YedK